jgi:Fic family protein
MIERAPSTLNFQLRDDIVQLLQQEDIIAILNQINEEYYHWHVIKRLNYPKGVNPLDIWNIVKLRRRITPTRIKFGDYSFNWNINNRLQEMLHFLDMHVGGTLESPAKIPSEDKGRYLISSLMEEAIASSQIEGAVTTRKKAKEMLRQNKRPANKSEQMIVNNYATIQRILEIKAEPLNTGNLLELHRLMTKDTMAKSSEEGAFRTDDDIDVVDTATGEVVHHPPDQKDLDVLLKDLYSFFNDEDNGTFVHPLIKACILHFMLGFIHPFTDGNGRTARALFYWYLLKKGYWLTEYLSISRLILKAKAQYARAFQYTEIDEHDLTYFILFNLRVMKLSFDDLRAYIQRKNDENKELSDFMGVDGISYRQSVILEWFYKEPTLLLTVKETQTRLAVSNGSARNDLGELQAKGYLQSRAINKVTNGYVRGKKFEGLLNKLRKTAKAKSKSK